MTSNGPLEVLPVGEARASLSQLLARFREGGSEAEPVFIGSHRRAEAVLLPISLFEDLAPWIEEILLAREVRRRLADDSGNRVAHDALLTELGIDPKTLR